MSNLDFKQSIIILVVLVSSFCDGIRDANIARLSGWWSWHIVKWLSMFSLWGTLLFFGNFFTKKYWRWIVVLSGLSMLVWWLGNGVNL